MNTAFSRRNKTVGYLAMAVALTCASLARGEPMEYSCVTGASKDATLSFTVSGRIMDIRHREGDTVKAGTPLADLERRVEELELERRRIVWKDKSKLEAAKAESETYANLLDSTKKLFDSTGSVSRDDLAKMEMQAKTSEAEYQRLLIAEQREKVEYELALANLERRTLTAPFDGTIVDVKLSEGEICEANQPMVKLVNTRQGFLSCNVEEPVGRKLADGDQVPVSIQAGTSRWTGDGEVVFVAPVVDPASGLLRVKIEFENSDGEVRPGVPGFVTLESEGALYGSTSP